MAETDLTTYLKENPRMMGVLFTMLLLLSQAGNASGALYGTVAGP
ncbi:MULTISPECIES: hypothetical protein [Halorussus]|nr:MULTISPECIES: hypothetical protein [Halorussus]